MNSYTRSARTMAPAFHLAFLVFAVAICNASAQIKDGLQLVRPTLLADSSAIVPGKSLSLGILFEIAPGWHIYWRNPGDAGLATSIDWDVPEGYSVSALHWPIPKRIVEPGDIQVFGYKNRVLLWVDINVPAELMAGSEARFVARAKWLVCEAICIPGSAEMEITLPVADTAAPVNEALFSEFRARVPSEEPPPFSVEWKSQPEAWEVRIEGAQDTSQFDFFPFEAETELHGHPQGGSVSDGSAQLLIPANRVVQGLLVRTKPEPEVAWQIKSPEWPATPIANLEANPNTKANALGDFFIEKGAGGLEPPTAGSIPSLWVALLYGALGGFILNFMPCVLPVISLKLFGFIRQSGESRAQIFRHGLAFVAGIFAWFLALGIVVVLLKGAGAQVTWAFQFQNPWFILFLCAVVFVFALNLFGVFEIVLPGAASSCMAEIAEREGYGGAFFQGVFATLLATPCTAPFLGPALGFAFSQPSSVIFGMFGAVAFGMAFPYILLSAQPAWIKWLPKPGAWMERLKQAMAFPLLATLIWLLSVIASQKGVAGMIWTLSLLLTLGFACWLYGSFCGGLSSPRTRFTALAFAALSAIGGAWFFGGLFAQAEPPSARAPRATASDEINWVPFSSAELDRLLAEDKPVFVDFTADWCITCKFNERTAINTPAVRALLAQRGIVAMKADWTNANPEITAALQAFGRVGVPFYVFYPKGRKIPPVIFPELLTEKILIEGLGGRQVDVGE